LAWRLVTRRTRPGPAPRSVHGWSPEMSKKIRRRHTLDQKLARLKKHHMERVHVSDVVFRARASCAKRHRAAAPFPSLTCSGRPRLRSRCARGPRPAS
jgi:hypothetical protein